MSPYYLAPIGIWLVVLLYSLATRIPGILMHPFLAIYELVLALGDALQGLALIVFITLIVAHNTGHPQPWWTFTGAAGAGLLWICIHQFLIAPCMVTLLEHGGITRYLLARRQRQQG